jgi:hypothetical protein
MVGAPTAVRLSFSIFIFKIDHDEGIGTIVRTEDAPEVISSARFSEPILGKMLLPVNWQSPSAGKRPRSSCGTFRPNG